MPIVPESAKQRSWPARPAFPERVCWGCDQYCPADDLRCGNEVTRAMHPIELFGPEWCALPEGQAHD